MKCRSPGPGSTIGVTTDGFIGSGRIGGTEARLAIAAGYDVVLSTSRRPQALKDLVEELGPQARAATPSGAAAAGDLVVSIPPRAYPAVPVKPLAGRPVLDTINYIPQRDERIPGLGGSLSSSGCSSGIWVRRTWSRCSATSPSGTSPRWSCGGRADRTPASPRTPGKAVPGSSLIVRHRDAGPPLRSPFPFVPAFSRLRHLHPGVPSRNTRRTHA